MISTSGYAKEVNLLDKKLNVVVDNGDKIAPKIIELANKDSITIDTIMIKRPSLEDVFIHYTGRSMREESGDGEKEIMRQRMKVGWR